MVLESYIQYNACSNASGMRLPAFALVKRGSVNYDLCYQGETKQLRFHTGFLFSQYCKVYSSTSCCVGAATRSGLDACSELSIDAIFDAYIGIGLVASESNCFRKIY